MLADQLGWRFFDADDLHPPANVTKMRGGIPLDDGDRLPWLQAVRDQVRACSEEGTSAVIACSALKQSYREFLLGGTGARLVYLTGAPTLLRERLENRMGHYMSAAMLDSQLETLEEPASGIRVDVSVPPEEVVDKIREALAV